MIGGLRSIAWPEWLVPVLSAWVTVRLIVIGAYASVRIAAEDMGDGSLPRQLGEELLAWDGGWYRNIATWGYDGVPLEGVRFFPGFAFAGRYLAPLFGGSETAALVAVANGASLLFLVGVYKLVRFEFDDPEAARWAVWTTALFPAGFVMAWAYSEPLMLACAVFAFLMLRRGRFLASAPLAFLAGLTRPLGALLALPAAVEAWRTMKVGGRPTVSMAAAVVAGPLGSLSYVLWASSHYDDWLIPLTIQSELRGETSLPPERILEGIGELFSDPGGDGLHLPFALGFVVLAVLAAKWLPASYSLFAGATLLVALGADNLNSLERYGLNAFPLAIGAGLLIWRYPRLRPPALAGGGALLVGLTSLAWWNSYVP